jgi:hypothetical protein
MQDTGPAWEELSNSFVSLLMDADALAAVVGCCRLCYMLLGGRSCAGRVTGESELNLKSASDTLKWALKLTSLSLLPPFLYTCILLLYWI